PPCQPLGKGPAVGHRCRSGGPVTHEKQHRQPDRI
ncbi:uncharacterized protein METZ01_LOCUS308295, partial [marine metagenome]